MIKFMYMTFLNEDLREGYKNKIHAQCKALANCNCQGELLIVSNNGFKVYEFKENMETKLNKTIEFDHKRKSINRNAYDELFIFFQFLSVAKEMIKKHRCDFIYIRQIVPITPMLLSFLKYVKKQNVKILYEYPTFPWKEDLKYITNTFFYYLDCILYNNLIKRVDNIICYGKYEGTNTKFIESMNGIEAEKFSIAKKNNHKQNEVHFIAVANVLEVHGYDRFIQGMYDYYKEPKSINVYFHIVGKVLPRLNLEKMVKDFSLEKYVIFHGYKSGKELDDLYDIMDCAIDTLAYYRRGEDCIAGSLKSREYLARGLPFVFSGNLDIAMNNSYDFMIRIPTEPEIIDINNLLNKFYMIASKPEDIKNYVINNLQWEKIMEKTLRDVRLIK